MELKRLPIHDETDVGFARRSVRVMAERAPFSQEQLAHIDLLSTELASNLVVHRAVEGHLFFQLVSRGDNIGIEIVSVDRGPGIPSVHEAMRDGYSIRGSLGIGLGTVSRCADVFDIHSLPVGRECFSPRFWRPEGTLVLAQKWLAPLATTEEAWRVVGHTEPCPGERYNGDGFRVWKTSERLRAVVCDGLGHGLFAHEVTQKVLAFCEDHLWAPPIVLLTEMHPHLRKTRGCAIAIVDIDRAEGSLSYIIIGNIGIRMYPRANASFLPHRGILGLHRLPTLRLRTVDWRPDATLLISSDGLSHRWELEKVTASPHLLSHEPSLLRHLLLRDHRRSSDDVTLLILREELS